MRGPDIAKLMTTAAPSGDAPGDTGGAAQWQAVDPGAQDLKQPGVTIPGFQLDWAARLEDEAAISATHLYALIPGS